MLKKNIILGLVVGFVFTFIVSLGIFLKISENKIISVSQISDSEALSRVCQYTPIAIKSKGCPKGTVSKLEAGYLKFLK